MIVLLHPACFLLPQEFHTCLNEASMGAVAIIQTAPWKISIHINKTNNIYIWNRFHRFLLQPD